MQAGRFISFEGGEGSGKSTQARALVDALRARCIPCLLSREPGGEQGAEAIRALLVASDSPQWEPMSETLLFMAARVQHVQRVILPALARGEVVVCDRFHDSTLAYQFYARNRPPAWYHALHRHCVGTLQPDVTFLLDIDPAVGLSRAMERNKQDEQKFEHYNLHFHQQVRAGLLTQAAVEPERIQVLDATQPMEALHKQILAHTGMAL